MYETYAQMAYTTCAESLLRPDIAVEHDGTCGTDGGKSGRTDRRLMVLMLHRYRARRMTPNLLQRDIGTPSSDSPEVRCRELTIESSGGTPRREMPKCRC